VLEERLIHFSFEEYSTKWDNLIAQVDKALQDMKDYGKEFIEANREVVMKWFVEVLHHMDLVDIRCNPYKQ